MSLSDARRLVHELDRALGFARPPSVSGSPACEEHEPGDPTTYDLVAAAVLMSAIRDAGDIPQHVRQQIEASVPVSSDSDSR